MIVFRPEPNLPNLVCDDWGIRREGHPGSDGRVEGGTTGLTHGVCGNLGLVVYAGGASAAKAHWQGFKRGPNKTKSELKASEFAQSGRKILKQHLFLRLIFWSDRRFVLTWHWPTLHLQAFHHEHYLPLSCNNTSDKIPQEIMFILCCKHG